MPELPEVETTCRGLAKALIGKRIAQVAQNRGDLRLPFPKNLAEKLTGRKIVAVTRRAKYILMALDNAQILLLHLGMSGRMVLGDDPAAPVGKHDHLILRFDGAGVRTLRFNDPRRFGWCDLVAKEALGEHRLLRHLGVEPLGPSLTAAGLRESLQGRKTSIKAALLDQRVIAGLGNIYVCEALFYAGISPLRRADSCDDAEIGRLVPAIKRVLRAAIKAGGSSLRDYVHTDGNLGYFQHHFAVYDREDQPCTGCDCDLAKTGGVSRVAQAGRSSYFCPVRQS